MIQIKNLTITHKKDNRVLLDNFSLILNDGDKAAIIGEEGNGKSTLLKLIYDEELVADYVDFHGEIIRNNSVIGYLAQELLATDKTKTVYEFLCELPHFFELTPKELADTGKRLHLSVDFFYSEQELGSLSGGEKIKLQMTKLLFQRPDVLLLDEPSNDLDLETLHWLEEFINESKIPVLYISHDETLLENTANKIVHIEQLKRKMEAKATVEKAGYREYVERRIHGLNKQEQVAKKERQEYDKQQEKFRQIQQKVEHRQNTISRQDPHGGRLLKKSMHRIKAYEARFEKEFENMTEIPETEDAIFIKFGEKAFLPSGKIVLDLSLQELCVAEKVLAKNVEFKVRGPEKVCIVGRNGCGKTTFLRLIAEELQERKDMKVSYMPQNYEDLLAPPQFLCALSNYCFSPPCCFLKPLRKVSGSKSNTKANRRRSL